MATIRKVERVDPNTFTLNPLAMPRVKLLIDLDHLENRDRALSPKSTLELYRPHGLGYYSSSDDDAGMHYIVLEPNGEIENCIDTGMYLYPYEFEFIEDAVVTGRKVIITKGGTVNLSFPSEFINRPALVIDDIETRSGCAQVTIIDILPGECYLNRWTSRIEYVTVID